MRVKGRTEKGENNEERWRGTSQEMELISERRMKNARRGMMQERRIKDEGRGGEMMRAKQ